MLLLTLRNLLAHKLRFALTTLSVVIGVGFVVGSFAVTDSLRGSVDGLFDEITGGIDVSVRPRSNLEGLGMMATRGRVSADLVDRVRAVDGVAAAEGSVAGYAQLLDRHGKPMTTLGAPFLGVSWGHVPELRPATLRSGRAPHGLGEVAIDRGTARDYGLQVGDRTRVLLADGSQPTVEVVGIFTFGSANKLLGARLTAFDVDVAPRLLAQEGEYDSIDVVAARGVGAPELAARLEAALPPEIVAQTGAEVADEGRRGMAGFLSAFQKVLLGFAGIALFVSAFVIDNTFAILVGQRTRQLALLRSLGASHAQVTVSVVGEAVLIGILAAVLGTLFGLLIAVVLQAILDATGFGFPRQPLALAPRTLVAGAVVGIAVPVLAALVPARRAATVPPVEGMQAGFAAAAAPVRRRLLLGALLAVTGGASMAYGLYGASTTPALVVGLAAGAVLVFVGVAQLSPVVALPVAGLLGRPVARAFGEPGQLAQANALRNPDRTARTASALMVGLALVTTVFVVGTSMKATFASAVRGSIGADFVVSTSGQIGFSPAITQRLAELPELAGASGVRINRFKIGGGERDLVALDASEAEGLVDIDLRSGSMAALDDRSILVHRDPAEDLGLSVGDHVEVQLAQGDPVRLTVAGVYDDAANVGNYVVDLALLERYYPAADLDLFAFARRAEGVSSVEARRAIERALADQPQVLLQDRSEFLDSQTAQLDSLLVAVNGLLGLALFIALLGIGNTLALAVLERTHEIGLLRAVGMGRRQCRSMVLAESAMVSVFGGVLGVALGVVFGVATAAALPASVVDRTAIPIGTIGVILVVAAACGILAGLAPARRAARLDVLTAVQAD